MQWMLNKMKTGVFVLWIGIAVLSVILMPSVDYWIREKGQPQPVPGYPSHVALTLSNELRGNQKLHRSEILVVFHDPKGLNSRQMGLIEKKIESLDHRRLKIDTMMNPFENKKLRDQLISKDRTTVMVPLTLDKTGQSIGDIQSKIDKQMKIPGVQTYITGKDLINEDYARTSVNGVKNTEIFTVLIICSVLILVFRSLLIPLVSLITVGLTYLVSLGVVMQLVERCNFPFSNATQIFLILVLFGIGTDYTILLFMRFKEELLQQSSVRQAVIRTFATAGKTIFFSGLAVLIGFSMLGFSQFTVYQSGVAVAFGVLFLLIAMFTLVPVWMVLLGKRLFWPATRDMRHSTSWIWRLLGDFSMKRPLVSVIVVAILALPAMVWGGNALSFNSIKEMDPSFDSVKGVEVVSNHFGKGQILPTTVILKAPFSLDSAEGLAFLDNINQRLSMIPGVAKVYGPTRPAGEKIDQLYIHQQTQGVHQGLDKSGTGLKKVSSGLKTAVDQIAKASSGDPSKVTELVTGTSRMIQGVDQIGGALSKIGSGLSQGASKSPILVDGVRQLGVGIQEVSSNLSQLNQGYHQLANGLQTLSETYRALAMQVGGIKGIAHEIYGIANQMRDSDSTQQLKEKALGLIQRVTGLEQHLAAANASLASATGRMHRINEGLQQIQGAHARLVTGSNQVRSGMEQLSIGLQQGSLGQQRVIQSLFQVKQGLSAVNNGQRVLDTKLHQLSSGFKELQVGLQKGAHGIDQVTGGLSLANQYLKEVSDSQVTSTLFVPKQVRERPDFKKALDMYMSDQRHIAKWMVILDEDPYSEKALSLSGKINDTMQHIVDERGDGFKVGVGGVSSTNNDFKKMSAADFSRTMMLMFAGIGVMLILLFRSFWLALMTLFCPFIAYFSALRLTDLIFTQGFHADGLSWVVPFFSFILIVALGVDYGIFFMMRFKEHGMVDPIRSVSKSVKYTGSIIVSAAFILCGTFAAMYPSGVNTLLQVATVVIIGLLLLAFLILPLLLPGVLMLLEKVRKGRSA